MKRTYTDEQRTEALAIYAEHGPHEAARAIGCDAGTVTRWAQAAGVTTLHTQQTQAANDRRRADADSKRQQLRHAILDGALESAQRIREPYTTHVGQQGKRVDLERPPADMVRNLMTAAAIGWDKETVAAGGVTDRTARTIEEGFSLDAALEDFTRGASAALSLTRSLAEHGTTGTAPPA